MDFGDRNFNIKVLNVNKIAHNMKEFVEILIPLLHQEAGIGNVSGNKYQGTKRLYSRLYNLYEKNTPITKKPEFVIVEDAKSR